MIEIVDNSLILGIGINLTHGPLADQPTISLADCGLNITPEILATIFITTFNDTLKILQEKGFHALKQLWLNDGLGYQVPGAICIDTVDLPLTFNDLLEDGRIVLTTLCAKKTYRLHEVSKLHFVTNAILSAYAHST